MAKIGLSVIVVSWNTREVTDACLGFLHEAVKKVSRIADVEVVVVENDSTDGSLEMIAKKHPWAKLFDSGSDLGYAKGNNYGVKRMNKKNEYLLLINNDAYVTKDTLVRSIEYMKSHPGCDVLGCELNYLDGRFQPSAGFLPYPVSVLGWIWGLDRLPVLDKYFSPVHPKDPDFFRRDREVGWVMGAFLFMKTGVFTATGGFDENFFMYMEEVEWCKRVHDAGYHIWYTPEFKVTHIDKASAFGRPEELSKIFYREIMGLMYYLKKYYPSHIWWLKIAMRLGISIRLLAFIIKKNIIRIEAYKKILKNI